MAQLLTACEEAQFLPESYSFRKVVVNYSRSIVQSHCLFFCGGSAREPVGSRFKVGRNPLCIGGFVVRGKVAMSEVLLRLFSTLSQLMSNGDESPVLGCFLGLHEVF